MIPLLSYTYVAGVEVYGVKLFKKSFVEEVFGYRRTFFPFRRTKPLRFSPHILRSGKERLERIYRDSGFFRVVVRVSDSLTPKGRVIRVYVEEGPRYTIREIHLPDDARGFFKLSLPRPYSRAFLTNLEVKLVEFYQERGYPFAKVRREEEVEETYVRVRFDVDKGGRIGIREVAFMSADTTLLNVRRKILYREVVFKKGECFSLSKLTESLSRLYRTLLFTSIRWDLRDIRPAGEGVCGDSTATLVFYLKVGKHRILDISAGLQSESEKPLLFSLEASFQHVNLFNNLQRVQVSSSNVLDMLNQRVDRFRGDVVYQEPYFLDFYLKANVRLQGEYDSNKMTRRIGLNGEVIKPYVLNRVEISLGPSVDMRWFDTTAYRVIKVFQKVYVDTRDDIFDPNWGSVLSFYLEEAGAGRFGDYDFLKVVSEISVYQKFFRSEWKWAARLRLGRAEAVLRSDTLPFFDLFTLGGEGQVRGYDRYSIGPSLEGCVGDVCKAGVSLLVFNYEVRRRVWNNVGFVVFFDYGQLSGDVGYSAGLGIRYFTPIGPLRVDWGLRLKGRSPTDRGKVYVGIGHMF